MSFKKKQVDEDYCLRLENQLCFPLYATSKAVIRHYKPFLDKIGLTYTQYLVMMVLWEKEAISMQDLGEELGLDSGTLTPLLVKLEEKGLVKRRRDEKDERRMDITATEKGIGLKVDAREVPTKMGTCIGVSPKEAMELKKILAKIKANLDERR